MASKKNCKLTQPNYFVLKKQLGHSTVFYATTEDTFTSSGSTSIDKTYKNQIAYGWCTKGWVKKIEVNAEPINARECGISTILTQLCMVDPEIGDIGEGNEALDLLKSYKAEKSAFLTTCLYTVGLKMAANPKTGAYAYFSAALKTGYTKMQIQHKKGWGQWTFYPNRGDSEIQGFRDTKIWQAGYDANTLNINDPEAPGGIYRLTENDNWLFCKPKPYVCDVN